MKVENISIRAYSEQSVEEAKNNEKDEKKNKNVINGAELKFGLNPAEKRIEQERKAMKVKLDQMLSDDDYNHEMKFHLEKAAKFKQDSLDNQNEIKEMQEVKNMVKEAYGIEDGSAEQQKLEEIEALREKKKSGEKLTDEEMVRLTKTDDLTDYQKLMLEYDDAIDEFQKRAEDSERLSNAHGKAVEAMKMALLEVHPMVDASKQANEMIKTALKEEQDSLRAEMKENYDEKVAEEKDKAEEAKEKQEEKQNVQEENSGDKEMQAILEAATEVDTQKNAKKNKKLLGEDLKGIEVDESV